MRYAIKIAPKNGQFVIIEDGDHGIYDVAQWSTKLSIWLNRSAKPTKIKPTHWHPLSRDEYFQVEKDDWPYIPRVSPSTWRCKSLVVAGAFAAVAVLLFYATRDSAQQKPATSAQLASQALPSQDSKSAHPAPLQGDDNQFPASIEAPQGAHRPLNEAPLASEPGQAHSRAEAMQAIIIAEELAEVAARCKELGPITAQHPKAQDCERAELATLTNGLATARPESKAQATQLRKADDEAGQLKQAQTAENGQSQQQVRQNAAALAETAALREAQGTSGAQQRQVLDEGGVRHAARSDEFVIAEREIETLEARLRDAADQIGQLKRAETMLAELQQSLQQERDKAASLARQMQSMRLVTCFRNSARQCEGYRQARPQRWLMQTKADP